MILPDINLLLYAYNPFSGSHEKARKWWHSALNGGELVGLPHEVTLGFVRIATNPRLGDAAVSLSRARDVVEEWMKAPHVRVLLPKDNHAMRVIELLEKSHGSGAIASDASLAVYAIENRATLFSNDSDFSRFSGLDWKNPLAGS